MGERKIAGAIHVGRGVLEIDIESRVPLKLTPVVVYCQGGGRSAVAAEASGDGPHERVLAGWRPGGL